MSRAPISLDRGVPGSDGEAVSVLAAALSDYLDEVADDMSTCQRHATTTWVRPCDWALALGRSYPRRRALAGHVRDAATRLPDWRQSPFWAADGTQWDQLTREIRAEDRGPAECLLFARGALWEGRPILVGIRSTERPQRLAVEQVLPVVERAIPELPVQALARGLRCFDYLLPERVAAALPLSAFARVRSLTLLEFLKRATPEMLAADQCISSAGAGD